MSTAAADRPPSIDPVAARRWAGRPHDSSPWLHEEVARRMAERLELIRLPVRAWADWEPARGGLRGHERVIAQYPDAQCFRVSVQHQQAPEAPKKIATGWWQRLRGGRAGATDVVQPPDASVQLVWANMLAHQVAEPTALMADWLRALAGDGFLMFPCLGPASLRKLRVFYASPGCSPPAHEFTDLHDWGDQLLGAGFADPVMDMERITLSFASPERLLQELRGLGRNLHAQRFAGLRTPAWRERLHAAMARRLASAADGGALTLSFEVIYGHAVKPPPRHTIAAQTTISLDDLKVSLRQRNRNLPSV